MTELTPNPSNDPIATKIADEIIASTDSSRARALKKFGLAAVGAIPWVGGFLAAAIELRKDPDKIDNLQRQSLEHHETKLQKLQRTLVSIGKRLENFDEEIDERLESPEFLALVDKGFREWDAASTEEKREYVRLLLTNAAASSLCSDDLVRLFLDWIRKYDDTHFRVIKAIYNNHEISRRDMWLTMHPTVPKDNSSEADLFKLLIHDLSLGHVIRQHRATTHGGQFLKQSTRGRTKSKGSSTMKSPFDASDPYELTELGTLFVHYVMNEVSPQIGDGNGNAT